MLVSRWVLQAYPTLRGEQNTNYFATKKARDEYYTQPKDGQICAINTNGTDPVLVDWNEAVWEVNVYSMASGNWVSVYLDSNFALTITNNGIEALTNAELGQYKLEISRVVIKQSLVPEGTNVSQYDHNTFINNTTSGYADVCLDTNTIGNTTFTLRNSLSYRINTLNGGLQVIVELGLDCMGQQLPHENPDATPTLTAFDVSTIGIYVKNQNNLSAGSEVLFAVATLPAPMRKLTTTPNSIGNAVKLYLNCTLSNLGNTVNVTPVRDSTTSVPEVTDEDDLIDTYDGINAPHNLYLIDNYNGTNVPALAVRKGTQLTPRTPINWTYFTPTDDTVDISPDLIDPSLKNYMVAAWDTDIRKYVPANSTSDKHQLSGLYVDGHLIYAGKVININTNYTYEITFNNENAFGYTKGDTLVYTWKNPTDPTDNTRFVVQLIDVDPISGKPLEYYVTPKSGNKRIELTNVTLTYAVKRGDGYGLTMSVASIEQARIHWDFDPSWMGKALYVDKNRPGMLSDERTGMFVGWCADAHSIKLGLDLRNEATFTTYGTTRYATNVEVQDVAGNMEASTTTSVTPEGLKHSYFQINAIGDNAGATATNPVIVDSYTKFNHTIIGSGMNAPTTWNDGISFYGTAFRAMWADLAEYYKSDRIYPGGTLICMGKGINEISIADRECNGIISTKPGYQLGEKTSELDLPVALVGRVPVLFANDCIPGFGDKIYLSKTMPGRASTIPNGKCLGKIIDKDHDLDQKTLIMCSVRIEF